MKFSAFTRSLSALALGAAAALPAQAYVIDFEDIAPALFSGSSVSSGGFAFASGGTGFSGVDSASAFSIFGNAPEGSSGQFLFALNADSLRMTQSNGQSFKLLGFDFGFVAPVGNVGTGVSAGMLHVEALAVGGGLITEDLDFGLSDATGSYAFSTFYSTVFASGVTAITFSACIYEAGACSFGNPLAQFALDDISLVSEPGGVTLALTALGLLAATRRRQTV